MGSRIDLAGTWRFQTDVRGDGEADKWYIYQLKDSVVIPGIMQAQGYGADINEDTCFMSSLHDELWYMREEYKGAQENGIKVPFLSQPPKHYMGKAWYQTDFNVPAANDACLHELFIECTRWKTKVWVDDECVGEEMSLCAPHRFMLGCLKAGYHRLTICVDNGFLLPYRPDGHGVSDALGANWNGMAGAVYIEAKPQVYLEDVKLYPDYDTRTVIVRGVVKRNVKAASLANEGEVSISAGDALIKLVPAGACTDFELKVSYDSNAKEWSEYEPFVHRLDVKLVMGETEDVKSLTFGFRKIEVKDGAFYVNDRMTYFRGTHFGGEFPKTGYPSTDVEYWKRIFDICKKWGINFIRCHSYCPPEAAFTAADEVGMYIQAECGMWNRFNPENDMLSVLKDETKRILDSFGNHPSFVMLSPSNEPSGKWHEPLMEWVRFAKNLDERRLYTMQSGWPIPCPSEDIKDTDYLYYHRSGQGPFSGGTIRNKPGWFDKDYSPSLEGVNLPVICHEMGQWCSYPDFDIIHKFKDCYLIPGNFEVFRARAEKMGVLSQNKEFVQASGKFQLQMYKQDLEANFRTPKIYGFELLDLHDYLGQGTALVGLLDAFWDEKGYAAPSDFAHFCAPTVLLLRMPKAVYNDKESFLSELEMAHFDKEPFEQVVIKWQTRDRADGKVYKSGSFEIEAVPLGKNIPVGKIEFDFGNMPQGRSYEIVVWLEKAGESLSFDTARISNYWNFWFYKTEEKINTECKTAIFTRSYREATEALKKGKKVLYMPSLSVLEWNCPPLSDRPAFWNSQMGPRYSRGMGLLINKEHPALKHFATESYEEWQWEQIVRYGKGFNISDFPADFKPIVQPIDEWNRSYRMSLILEAKIDDGRLLMISADLFKAAEKSAAPAALFKSLLDYVDSDEFEPEVKLSWELFENNFADTLSLKRHNIKALFESPCEPKRPLTEEELIKLTEGDPGKMFMAINCELPAVITLTAPEAVMVKGLKYMPGQFHRSHLGDIKNIEIDAFIGDRFITIYRENELPSSFDLKKLTFSMPVKTDRLRIRILGGFDKARFYDWEEKTEGWICKKIDFVDKTVAIGALALDIDDDSWQDMTSDEIVYREAKTITVEIDD